MVFSCTEFNIILSSDNGKPVERQGRKAKGLRSKDYDSLVAELERTEIFSLLSECSVKEDFLSLFLTKMFYLNQKMSHNHARKEL